MLGISSFLPSHPLFKSFFSRLLLESCPGTACRAWCMLLWSTHLIYSWWRTTVQIYIEIHPKLYEVWSRQKFDLQLWPWPCAYLNECFKMAHLHVMANNCFKLFWNPSTIVEVMVQTNSNGRMDTCTQKHIHQPVIVTTMSCSPKVGSTKSLLFAPKPPSKIQELSKHLRPSKSQQCLSESLPSCMKF